MAPTLIFLLGVGAFFAGASLALVWLVSAVSERRAVGRSLAAIRAIDAAPSDMRAELEPPFVERVLKPAWARLVAVGHRLSGRNASVNLRHKLDRAGNPPGWDVDRILAHKVLGAVTGAVIGMAVGALLGISVVVSIVVCAVLVVAGYGLPDIVLSSKGQQRETAIRRALPDAIDLLTISVEAGLGFDAALDRVARNTEGPIGEEFTRVLQEMQIGMGRTAAMRALAERTTLQDLRGFVSSMVQADAFGIPVGQVLRVQSREMRTKRRQRAEETAQKVPVKILFPLVFCILPTLFIAVLGPAAITIMENLGGLGG